MSLQCMFLKEARIPERNAISIFISYSATLKNTFEYTLIAIDNNCDFSFLFSYDHLV